MTDTMTYQTRLDNIIKTYNSKYYKQVKELLNQFAIIDIRLVKDRINQLFDKYYELPSKRSPVIKNASAIIELNEFVDGVFTGLIISKLNIFVQLLYETSYDLVAFYEIGITPTDDAIEKAVDKLINSIYNHRYLTLFSLYIIIGDEKYKKFVVAKAIMLENSKKNTEISFSNLVKKFNQDPSKTMYLDTKTKINDSSLFYTPLNVTDGSDNQDVVVTGQSSYNDINNKYNKELVGFIRDGIRVTDFESIIKLTLNNKIDLNEYRKVISDEMLNTHEYIMSKSASESFNDKEIELMNYYYYSHVLSVFRLLTLLGYSVSTYPEYTTILSSLIQSYTHACVEHLIGMVKLGIKYSKVNVSIKIKSVLLESNKSVILTVYDLVNIGATIDTDIAGKLRANKIISDIESNNGIKFNEDGESSIDLLSECMLLGIYPSTSTVRQCIDKLKSTYVNSKVYQNNTSNVLRSGNSNMLRNDSRNMLRNDSRNMLRNDSRNMLWNDNSNMSQNDNSNMLLISMLEDIETMSLHYSKFKNNSAKLSKLY